MIKQGRDINIIWGYILFVSFLLTSGAVVFWGSYNTKKNINSLTTNLIRTNELLYDFKKGMLTIQDQIDKHIDATTLAEKDSIQAEISLATIANNNRLQQIKNILTSPNEVVLVNDLDKNRILALSLRPELFRLSKLNKDSALNFNRLYQNEAFHDFLISYDQLSDYVIKATQQKSKDTQSFISSIQLKIVISVMLSLASLLYLGWLVYTSKQQLIQQNKIIKKREAKFKNFIEAMPDASLAVNKSGEIIYFNKQATLLFGYTGAELLNNKIEMLMPERSRANHPKQREGYYAKPENRLMGGSSKDLYGRKKDGSEFACDIALNSIETDEGVIVLSTIRDITDKKKAEQELINTGLQLNKAQEIAHLGAWEHNLIDNKVFWSDETYRILEIDKNKLDPSLCYDAYLKLIHPDDLEMVNASYKKSIDTKTSYTKDYRFLFPDGRIKYVEEQCETIYDINDNPIKSFGTLQDITVRKVAELKVLTSESRLNKAQEIAHLGSWELDLVNNDLSWSDGIYRIFEIEKNEFGASYEAFLNAIHPDDREMVNKAYTESVKNKTTYRIIHRLQFPDGRIKYVEEQCETIYDINDIPLKSFGTVQDITERKVAELAVINSESQLKKAQEIAHLGSWELDFSSGISTLSDETCRIYGLSLKENKQTMESWLSHIHPDDFDFVAKSIKKAQETLRPISFYHRILRKDGTIRYTFTESVFEFDNEGKAIGLNGIVHDVTERIEAEELLKESETKYQGLFESMLDGVYKSSPEGKFFDVNPAMVSMLGYKSKKDLMSINIKTDLYFDEADRELARKQEATGEVAVIRLRKKDGTEIWAEDRGHYVLDENGNLLYNEGVLRDVTERVKAERELIRSEIFNRGVLNSLSHHIAVIDSIGNIIEVNEAWKEFARENGDTTLKRTSEGTNYIEVCKKAILAGDAYAKEALDGIRSVFNHDAEVFVMEYPCHSPTEERWFNLRVTEFKSDKPMVVLAHGNITSRKLAELEREKVASDLIYKNKDLEQFAYIVSHNLRAPVANIIGLTDMLKNTDIPEESKVEFNKGLFLSANKLDVVIQDLNSILQVRGQVIEKKEKVVLSKVVTNIEESIHTIIETNGAVIHTDFSAIDEINSVKSYIYSIFYNLILNSIKYRKVKVKPVIEIRTELIGDKKVIRFKDNGIGFNMGQNKEHVFGLYKRFNPEIEGKGVGLYMVKQQVESLGGTIELKSELGKGAEFSIEFKRTN